MLSMRLLNGTNITCRKIRLMIISSLLEETVRKQKEKKKKSRFRYSLNSKPSHKITSRSNNSVIKLLYGSSKVLQTATENIPFKVIMISFNFRGIISFLKPCDALAVGTCGRHTKCSVGFASAETDIYGSENSVGVLVQVTVSHSSNDPSSFSR